MSFAAPIALALLTLAAPIVLFYILKIRLRRVPVSTNLFWKQIYDEKPPRSIWQQLRHLLSLLLQLLMLTLLVLAIADPYFSWQLLQARRLVIVLDTSASMRCEDVKPSRFDAAKEEAHHIINGRRFRDEVAIIAAGSRPEVITGLTGHTPTLRRAVDSVNVTDSPAEVGSAEELGLQLIGGHPHGQVIILTDGCQGFPEAANADVAADTTAAHAPERIPLLATTSTSVPAADTTPQHGNDPSVAGSSKRPPGTSDAETVEPVVKRIFATNAANVGITQFQVRRSLVDPMGYEILATVTNAASNPVRCRLELTLDDVPIDVLPLQLKSDETWTRSIEKTSLNGGRVTATLTSFARGIATTNNDATTREEASTNNATAAGPPADSASAAVLNQLTVDDRAVAILPSRAIQKVLVVSPGNLFLRKVFEASQLVEVTVASALPASIPAETIVILHRIVPPVLPSGPVLVIDPESSCEAWDIGGKLENPIITEQDKTSPLMTHIRLDNVLVPEARQLNFRSPPKVLAGTVSGESVYAEIPRATGRCLVLCVNLDKSDLAFRTAFPILATNALAWFSGQTGELREAVATGSLMTIPLDDSPKSEPANSETPASTDFVRREASSSIAASSPVTVTSVPNTSNDRRRFRLRSPSGDEFPVQPGEHGFLAGPFNEAGVWTIERTAEKASSIMPKSPRESDPLNPPSDQATPVAEIAVNLASRRESDLRPPSELLNSEASGIASSGWLSHPIWFALVIAACLLTSIEWVLYQRRVMT